jgi:hypothetical protein
MKDMDMDKDQDMDTDMGIDNFSRHQTKTRTVNSAMIF